MSDNQTIECVIHNFDWTEYKSHLGELVPLYGVYITSFSVGIMGRNDTPKCLVWRVRFRSLQEDQTTKFSFCRVSNRERCEFTF